MSGDVLFDQADLRRAAVDLDLEVRNFPDLTYNLRSRAPLPTEIKAAGFSTIAIRGRGKYALVKGNDEVKIPTRTAIQDISTGKIPKAVRDLLRGDEQSILSAIRYLDIISEFMSERSYHVQGHLRTTGSYGQQVEADDVWGASKKDESRIILPVEAKGPHERLGRHQMISTADAVRQKFPGMPIIPLAVKLEKSGRLVLIEFEPRVRDIVPVRFKRYKLKPKLPLWP